MNLVIMSEDSTPPEDRTVPESEVTNEDGTRYRTLVVDKSGETTTDS